MFFVLLFVHHTLEFVHMTLPQCTVVGSPPGASCGFYLRKAFQSPTHTEKLLYSENRETLIYYRN